MGIIHINDCAFNESDIFSEKILNAASTDDAHIVNLQISTFAYCKIIEKRLDDYYKQLIIKNMVYYYRDRMEFDIETNFSPFASEDNVQLIEEDERTTVKRENLSERRRFLEMSLKLLNEIY
jgi:hypothetical protein